MQPLYLNNILSRKKELFEPLNAPHVGMYVCGPTVYSNVHLGNVRTFLSFDIIYRYLKFIGYKVRYIRNITDVGHLVGDTDDGEDKIGKVARLQKIEPMEVVQKYTNDFHDVMRVFNILPPSIEPTATGHIIEQITFVQKIINNGYAYEVNGSVYFNVRKFSEDYPYGELSGRKIDELMNNTRELDGQSEKRDPLDFALWKNADESHLMKWPSPWGMGFPGWHLECSVMSTKYLGEEFDIHGGGMDLKFPHHECEIAQNIGANKTLNPIKYWLHGNMLTVNGRKMAKSEGNGFTPEELITGNHKLLERGYSPMTVRFFMLMGHYASTLDFSNEALQAAEKGLSKLNNAIEALGKIEGEKTDNSEVDIKSLEDKCYAAMNDDFNTPILIAKLFEGVKIINSAADGRISLGKAQIDHLKSLYSDFMKDVLGLVDEGSKDEGTEDLVSNLLDLLVEMRLDAKEKKDWDSADRIRNTLSEMGIAIKDSKEGSTWSHE
ncbi:MAG: cysteine--tRNA ligase [Bacteroidota bacterium]|nr:cysteine--tRNA ligase [Bacteroidota bacterium]